MAGIWLLLGAVAGWLVLARNRRLGAFLLVSTLLAAVPLCTSSVGPRLMLPVSLGACAFLGCVVEDALWWTHQGGRSRQLTAGLVLLAVGMGQVALPALHVPAAFARIQATDADVGDRASGLPWDEEVRGRLMVLLNAPHFLAAAFDVMDKVAREGQGPLAVHIAGVSGSAVRLHRDSLRSMVLRPDGGYLQNRWESIVRGAEPFSPGTEVVLAGVVVKVEEVTADGRPLAVRLTWNADVDPVWAAWNSAEQRYEGVRLPAIGGAATLAGAAAQTSAE